MDEQLRRITAVIVLVWCICANAEPQAREVENSVGDRAISSDDETSLFYRGDLDDAVVTAENGARVNADYAAFMADGAWSEVKVWSLGDRVHSITGYGLPNYTFIEGETGLILFDTGANKGMGVELIKKKQAFSDKPVVAIIYSHHHYTGGAGGVMSAYPDREIPVYGHPKLDDNLLNGFIVLGPASMRRGPMQMGHYLPDTGPDAFLAIEEPHFDDPSLNAHAHRAVTHPVADGESIVIDGLEFVFHHAIADTDDSLIVHVPELDLVMHNAAVMPFLFPLYTLRGDFYRSVPHMIESIDLMRRIRPGILAPCHGAPVVGADAAHEKLTMHRDAFAYLYQQTVQGINAGMTPDELAAEVRLPQHWAEYPELFPAYVDVEHVVRGIYRGLIGWWAEDTADLHPPSEEEFNAVIVDGFGGASNIIDRAREAYEQKKYNLAAKLLSSVLAVEPDNVEARQLKADALRSMAQATPTGVQTRSYMLTEALHLEGQLNRNLPPTGRRRFPPPSVDSLLSMPIGAFVGLLEYRIDAEVARDLDAVVAIRFTDSDSDLGIAVRRGAVEFTAEKPVDPDVELQMKRRTWIEMILRVSSFSEQQESGAISFAGDRGKLDGFLNAYKGVL